MKKHLKLKEIEDILLEIGFVRRSCNEEPGFYYEFYQKYPTEDFANDKNPSGSNLWVSFGDYNDVFYVYINCLYGVVDYKIQKIKDEKFFLRELDVMVLNGRGAFIYNDRFYKDWADAADEQRKKYFDNRMKMKSKPCKEVLDIIKKDGLDHFPTLLDVKYKDKKIGEMSWEALAQALIK